jgi:hypothetical protein
MRGLIQFPLKLIWFERYQPELYDLAADPQEQHDLAPEQPGVVDLLRGELERYMTSLKSAEPGQRPPVDLPRDAEDRLRALGYLGDGP